MYLLELSDEELNIVSAGNDELFYKNVGNYYLSLIPFSKKRYHIDVETKSSDWENAGDNVAQRTYTVTVRRSDMCWKNLKTKEKLGTLAIPASALLLGSIISGYTATRFIQRRMSKS